jgi:hypothetical protein
MLLSETKNKKISDEDNVFVLQTQAMALTNRGCRTPPASTPPLPQAHRPPEPPPPPVRTPPSAPAQQETALHPSPKDSYELSKSNSGESRKLGQDFDILECDAVWYSR